MKKVLVLMGAFLAFAACEPKADCDCTLGDDMVNHPLFTETEASIVDFVGTCEEVTAADLNIPEEWADFEEWGLTLSCVER